MPDENSDRLLRLVSSTLIRLFCVQSYFFFFCLSSERYTRPTCRNDRFINHGPSRFRGLTRGTTPCRRCNTSAISSNQNPIKPPLPPREIIVYIRTTSSRIHLSSGTRFATRKFPVNFARLIAKNVRARQLLLVFQCRMNAKLRPNKVCPPIQCKK